VNANLASPNANARSNPNTGTSGNANVGPATNTNTSASGNIGARPDTRTNTGTGRSIYPDMGATNTGTNNANAHTNGNPGAKVDPRNNAGVSSPDANANFSGNATSTNPDTSGRANIETNTSGTVKAPIKFSLCDEFADDSNLKYPATELILSLGNVASLDISTLKRNSLTAYQLLSGASDVYKAINELIYSIETGQTDSWDDFENYIAAISPMEKCVSLTLCMLILTPFRLLGSFWTLLV
jgi:hypothetical protein